MPRNAMASLDEKAAPEDHRRDENGPDDTARPDFVGGDVNVYHHEFEQRQKVEDRHYEMSDDVSDRNLPPRLPLADDDFGNGVGHGFRDAERERKKRHENNVDGYRHKKLLMGVEQNGNVRPVPRAEQRSCHGDGEAQYADHDDFGHGSSYRGSLLARSGTAVLRQKSAIAVQNVLEPQRTAPFDKCSRPVGKPDHHRIENRGGERSAHDNLIYRLIQIARRRNVEKRDHIRELADLREGKTHLDGRLDVDTGQKRAGGAVDELAAHDDNGQQKYRRPVRPALGGIDPKPDRDEKHRREHVAQRFDKSRQTRAHLGARTYDTDQKRSESRRKIETIGDVCDEKAETQKSDEKRLLVVALGDRGEKARNEDKPEKEHRDKKDAETAERLRYFGDIHSRAVGDTRYKRDHSDADYIFADRSAQHIFDERSRGPAHLVDHLRQKRRRRIADRRSEKKRGDRPPSEARPAYRKA